MKTKEVILDGWANVYKGSQGHEILLFDKPLEHSSYAKYAQTKCKVILEVPEKTVEISESEFEKLFTNNFGIPVNESKCAQALKKELFGE